MMIDNLSKKDKAGLRALIEKGVQAQFRIALEEVAGIIEQWKAGKKANRDAYQALFSSIHDNDKFIARRYDGVTGSRYVITVVGIYRDKQITDDDLMILSPELRGYIKAVDGVL